MFQKFSGSVTGVKLVIGRMITDGIREVGEIGQQTTLALETMVRTLDLNLREMGSHGELWGRGRSDMIPFTFFKSHSGHCEKSRPCACMRACLYIFSHLTLLYLLSDKRDLMASPLTLMVLPHPVSIPSFPAILQSLSTLPHPSDLLQMLHTSRGSLLFAPLTWCWESGAGLCPLSSVYPLPCVLTSMTLSP